MTSNEWGDFCRELSTYFGAVSLMNKERVQLWYDECHFVPMEALDWIKRKIFDEHDSQPRNLPKAIKALWYAWKDANPERIAPIDVHCDAPGCREGRIEVFTPRTSPHEYPYKAIAWCDRCAVRRRMCKENDPALDNLAELERRGYVPVMQLAGYGGERWVKRK